MKKFVSVLLVLFACIAFSGIAHAGEIMTSLNISANVIPVCQVTTSPVDFGSVAVGTTNTANGDVSVNCVSGESYQISLQAGQNYVGTLRRVTDGVSYIEYGLYSDAAYTQEWGDNGSSNTYPANGVGGIGDGSWQPHTVYGKMSVPAGASVGDYEDIVNVRFEW